jgi:hypothetical protein
MSALHRLLDKMNVPVMAGTVYREDSPILCQSGHGCTEYALALADTWISRELQIRCGLCVNDEQRVGELQRHDFSQPAL